MNDRPIPASGPPRAQGRHIGPIPVTLPLAVVVLALVGSLVFIAWVTLNVHDDQITLLSVGFVVLGGSFAALAIGSLLGMWHAASRSEGGRSFALAIVGGLAGLAAIGSFTIAALLTMVLNT